MSDKKRTIPEIQQEYQNACLRAGHLQYQVFTLSNDLEMLNSTLRDLNLEAAAVKAADDKAKKQEEEPAKLAAVAEESSNNQSQAV